MNLWTAMNRLLQFLFFGALHGEVESSVNRIGLKYPSLGIEYVPRSWKFYNGRFTDEQIEGRKDYTQHIPYIPSLLWKIHWFFVVAWLHFHQSRVC